MYVRQSIRNIKIPYINSLRISNMKDSSVFYIFVSCFYDLFHILWSFLTNFESMEHNMKCSTPLDLRKPKYSIYILYEMNGDNFRKVVLHNLVYKITSSILWSLFKNANQ
jgi:hypothetical protein